MSWELVWTRPALHDMDRLDRQVAQRVHTALEPLALADEGDIRRLQGVDPPQWRLRVGDWRVRFTYEADTVRVLRVLPRGRAYRD